MEPMEPTEPKEFKAFREIPDLRVRRESKVFKESRGLKDPREIVPVIRPSSLSSRQTRCGWYPQVPKSFSLIWSEAEEEVVVGAIHRHHQLVTEEAAVEVVLHHLLIHSSLRSFLEKRLLLPLVLED
jgi:hypothetical protein